MFMHRLWRRLISAQTSSDKEILGLLKDESCVVKSRVATYQQILVSIWRQVCKVFSPS